MNTNDYTTKIIEINDGDEEVIIAATLRKDSRGEISLRIDADDEFFFDETDKLNELQLFLNKLRDMVSDAQRAVAEQGK